MVARDVERGVCGLATRSATQEELDMRQGWRWSGRWKWPRLLFWGSWVVALVACGEDEAPLERCWPRDRPAVESAAWVGMWQGEGSVQGFMLGLAANGDWGEWRQAHGLWRWREGGAYLVMGDELLLITHDAYMQERFRVEANVMAIERSSGMEAALRWTRVECAGLALSAFYTEEGDRRGAMQ